MIKKILSPTPNNKNNPKKNTLPQQKKVRKEKKAEIPEKKLERNSPEKKNKP